MKIYIVYASRVSSQTFFEAFSDFDKAKEFAKKFKSSYEVITPRGREERHNDYTVCVNEYYVDSEMSLSAMKCLIHDHYEY